MKEQEAPIVGEATRCARDVKTKERAEGFGVGRGPARVFGEKTHQAKRFFAQHPIDAGFRVRRGVALGESLVEDVENGREARGELVGLGELERRAFVAQALLRAHDALRDGALVGEERSRDLAGGKAVGDAERERDLGGARERRMTREKNEAQLVVDLGRGRMRLAEVALFEGRVAAVAPELIDDGVVRDADEPTLELDGSLVGPAFDGTQARLLYGGFDECELPHAEAAHERGGHAAERRAKLALERQAPRIRARHGQDASPLR